MELIDFTDTGVYINQLHRRVQHFGHQFDYRSKLIDKDNPLGPLPAVLEKYSSKVVNCQPSFLPWDNADQITINEYEPGQGIGHHTDSHGSFEDGVAIISLSSNAVMTFRHTSGRKKAIQLPQRSLLLMRGKKNSYFLSPLFSINIY
jgi:alkylated DNA repair protein alkB family protein 8